MIIGSCCDGDPIAIDTLENDRIVRLDHENFFEPDYFNRSIEEMADFLIIYQDFEMGVLKDKLPPGAHTSLDLIREDFNRPEDLIEHLCAGDSMQVYNFTDQQFATLRDKMSAVDEAALTEPGFWEFVIDNLMSARDREFPGYRKDNDAPPAAPDVQ